MYLRSHPTAGGLIALAALIAGYLALRGELALAQELQRASVAAPTVQSETADRYCERHQADGCWPQLTAPE